MIYYKNKDTGVIEGCPLVYMLDDLKHDYYFVYQVIDLVVQYIKTNITNDIKKITYVSDGCPGQYKNVYNFQTVCHHEEDFGMPCEWVFFATAHGKSACDGLCGTTKRLTTMPACNKQSMTRSHVLRKCSNFACWK